MSNVFIQGGDSIEFDVSGTTADESVPGVGDVVQLIYVPNSGTTARAFVKPGAGAQMATDAGYALLALTVQYLYIGFAADTIACLAGSSGRLTVTRGTIR